ncbi:hypothetical protein A8C56_11500 [Niabella ginsenosidivorans]|uniref:Beta-lactamase-related domain-containing protein n=2 Tax=Niabella ginsenosidivorans TaxID=1176587 RepID=A0A1A9I384_9BACT|nr:hypothetical protein A8C56_11500 [Niabella ginsenosidivorans]
MRFPFFLYLLLAMTMLNGLASANAQGFDAALEKLVARQYASAAAPGAAVFVLQGKDRFVKGYGLADLTKRLPVTPQTQFRLASVSKQFTARSIYELIRSGKLQYTTALGTLFNDLPKAVRAITVRQLLQHCSGILDYENLIPADQHAQLSDEDVLRLIQTKDSVYFQPGSKFRYSNTGYCLLALIVQKLGGMRYEDFVKQQVFDPLALNEALVAHPGVFIPHRAYGYHPEGNGFRFADQSLTSATKGDGGVYMSVEAYARWARVLIESATDSNGYFNTIIKDPFPVKDGIGYNLGWFICTEADGSTAVFHSGESTGFHNIVYINPHKNTMVIIFSNRDDFKIAALFQDITAQVGIGPKALAIAHTPLFNWLNSLYAEQ